MSTFMAGMVRTITSAKQKLGLKITEGKKRLSLKAYSLMARKLFGSECKEDIFAHLFLVLDWCLMKRAENCVNAKIKHIIFRYDCLVFEFAKSTGNQKGKEHVGRASQSRKNLGSALWLPWHVICFVTRKFSKDRFLSLPVETKSLTADTRSVSRCWLRT